MEMYGCGNSTLVIIFFLAAERTPAIVVILQMARRVSLGVGKVGGSFHFS